MAVIGVGIDIVDVRRVQRIATEHGERFLKRVFSDEELSYCMRFADPFPHLAARWAAKEAIAKALGTGFSSGVTWKSISIIHTPKGEPVAVLEGNAQKLARSLSVRKIWVSLSHTQAYAAAVVIMET